MSNPSRRARSLWLASLLLLVATLLVYGRTAHHGFLSYDDGAYITENPRVRAGLTLEGVRWAWSEFHASNWHPLTWLSHMLDVECFGLDAGKHHLVSAGLHALNAVLCLLALQRLTGSFWPSLLVAAFFALHPQRVESVAWAAERKDVLSGTFFFLTLLAYERYARAPSAPRMALVAAALALGLFAKPMLVSVPFVLLLLDRWPLLRAGAHGGVDVSPSLAPTHPGDVPRATARGRGGYGLLLEKLPLFALGLASCAVTLAAQHAGGAVRSVESLPLGARVASSFLAVVGYLGQAICPSGLAFFYPHPAYVFPEAFSAVAPRVWAAGLFVLAVSVLAIAARARVPALCTGWFWMLIMLVPVIGLVQVGGQWIADRYAYLPLLGFTVAVVFGLEQLVSVRSMRRALVGLGFLLASAAGALAHRQVGHWKDMRALCEHALAVTERNYVAHDHLGLLFQKQKDLARAREHYEATIAIAPRLVDAHSNLGAVFAELGERGRAIECFQEALRLQPDSLVARLSWGFLCEREGDQLQALEHYELAARDHPSSAAAWSKVGDALFALGRYEPARAAYARALELEDELAAAHAGLGLALIELGQGLEAEAHLGEALRLQPDSPQALDALAFHLASSADERVRDPARALELLRSCESRGEPPGWRHLRALAAALAARGEFERAALTVAQASAAAPPSEWERLRSERELYQAGQALAR